MFNVDKAKIYLESVYIITIFVAIMVCNIANTINTIMKSASPYVVTSTYI